MGGFLLTLEGGAKGEGGKGTGGRRGISLSRLLRGCVVAGWRGRGGSSGELASLLLSELERGGGKCREWEGSIGNGIGIGIGQGKRGHHVQYVDPDWRWQSSQWS